MFLFSISVTGQSFMSISLLVLELWNCFWYGIDQKRNTLIQVLPKILRLGQLGIYLAQMFTIKCFWILQNARVTVFTTFTVSELLRETNSRNLQGFHVDNSIIEGLWNFLCFIKSAFCFSFFNFENLELTALAT